MVCLELGCCKMVMEHHNCQMGRQELHNYLMGQQELRNYQMELLELRNYLMGRLEHHNFVMEPNHRIHHRNRLLGDRIHLLGHHRNRHQIHQPVLCQKERHRIEMAVSTSFVGGRMDNRLRLMGLLHEN